ncbi:aldose 1-epimerase [uncultured Fibrobacter sp.]|uniref:aldose 1-epimerase n=1 Tax=uncultured Fibrobacter sp. TaxID=261512 RepID=UPI002603734E|nr:aldose 1-epimerase [uncultured Fibrobacter sp.]
MSQFKLISRPLGTIACYVLQRDDGAEFEFLSGFGGGLNAWRVPVENFRDSRNSTMLDLLYGYRDEPTLRKIYPDTNAGCRLAPFPGRTAFAQFQWRENTYKLVNNVSWAPHALHGFLQDKEWAFESFESDNDSCTATFCCDWPGAFAGFPFPFRAINTINFTGESVTITSIVKNIGKSDLPYSEGWHPYFMLGEKIDNLTLKLPQSTLALLDSNDLPTGKFKEDQRFTCARKINDEFINDCFCLEKEMTSFPSADSYFINNAHVLLESNRYSLDIWQKAGIEQYNAIQIYTPPDRMSIAIEPMTSEPDALNHHRGLIVIPPGEERTFTFGFHFHEKQGIEL